MKPEDLVAEVFGVDPDELDDTSSPETVEDWDSLGHVNLVMEIERVYDVSLSTDDALEILLATLGPRHDRTVAATQTVADFYERQGRSADAERLRATVTLPPAKPTTERDRP